MLDLATRAHNHSYRIDPVLRSLLDTDFYKFLMLQFIWLHYRNVPVTFSLINRTTAVRLADVIPEAELRAQLDHARTLRFTKSELIWLAGNTFYGQSGMFRPDFLAFYARVQAARIVELQQPLAHGSRDPSRERVEQRFVAVLERRSERRILRDRHEHPVAAAPMAVDPAFCGRLDAGDERKNVIAILDDEAIVRTPADERVVADVAQVGARGVDEEDQLGVIGIADEPVNAEPVDADFLQRTATLRDVEPGSLTITAVSYDDAGNVEQTPHVLTVDVR